MGYPTYDLTLARALRLQRKWSEMAFGPSRRTKGLCEHIRKELKEVEHSGGSVNEWVDVLILTLDALWRTGAQSDDIARALRAKIATNSKREWPDWRSKSEDEAIEHVRSPAEQDAKRAELMEREAAKEADRE